MKDDRQYKVSIQHGAGTVWVRNINHAEFMDGIQNGGLQFFGSGRQKIVDFQPEIRVSNDIVTCGGKFGCE